MNFKKLFIGGLCVSAVFAACTKEISVESSFEGNNAALSLGEGVTITGSKLGIDTRAEFSNDFTALWNDGDLLGAAWYDMVTSIDEETGKVNHIYTPSGKFMSNTWFEKITEGTVATADFQTTANLMAGAYVLYFPYDPTWTIIENEIPVIVSPEQTMDITPGNELAHINENIFAYTTYKAVPGGAQLGKFALKQLTNVLGVRFAVYKPELMLLEKPVIIKKVILESENILFSDGAIELPAKLAEDAYEKALPAGKYQNKVAASRIVLDVTGEADGYKIEKLTVPGVADNRTKSFYVSALPWNEISNVEDLTVKILATKEGEDKEIVYAGHLTEAGMENFNEYAGKEGVNFPMTIVLDEKLEDTGEIYTEDQFKAKWAEANKAGQKDQHLVVKTDINLPDFDLDPVVAEIIIESEGEVVVGNVNVTTGSLTANDLTVSGDLDVARTGKLNVDKATVEGDLNVDGSLTMNENLTVEGDFYFDASGKIEGKGSLAVDGKTTVVGKIDASIKITKLGEVEILRTGDLTIDGNVLVENGGNIGKVLNDEGTLTLKSINITGTLDNTGTVTIADGAVTVTSTGVINNNGTLTTSATNTLTNYGVINQNMNSTKSFYFNNMNDEKKGKGTVNVNAGTIYSGDNASEINVAPGVKLTLGSAYTGNGVINAEGAKDNKATVTANKDLSSFAGTIVANKYTVITDNDTNVFNQTVVFVIEDKADMDEVVATSENNNKVSTLRIKAKDVAYNTAKMNNRVLELCEGASIKATVQTCARYKETIVKGNATIDIAEGVTFMFDGAKSDPTRSRGIVEGNAVLSLTGNGTATGNIYVKSASNVAFGKDVTNSTTLILY